MCLTYSGPARLRHNCLCRSDRPGCDRESSEEGNLSLEDPQAWVLRLSHCSAFIRHCILQCKRDGGFRRKGLFINSIKDFAERGTCRECPPRCAEGVQPLIHGVTRPEGPEVNSSPRYLRIVTFFADRRE